MKLLEGVDVMRGWVFVVENVIEGMMGKLELIGEIVDVFRVFVFMESKKSGLLYEVIMEDVEDGE